MVTAFSDKEIVQLLKKQLNNFFTLTELESKEIDSIFQIVKCKIDYCFIRVDNKYFNTKREGIKEALFNPFHSAQYCIFLYYYSRTIYTEKNDTILADKIYYLNKALNAVDLFYGIEMPKFWACEHPIGSVMGRATYGEGFEFLQCCTVGGNKKLQYPVIGSDVHMFAHSQIIGNCHIGDHVLIGANCTIKDQDVPSNSIVFGMSPNLIIKSRKD